MPQEQYLHRLFDLSLLVKAVFAACEILAAIGAYVITPPFLSQLVAMITQAELDEDPRDLIGNYLVGWAQHLTASTQHFMALYLLSHGMIKLWLVIGLLRERLWYYPTALIVFTLFVAYQLYRFNFTNSLWLLLITAVDVIVIWLTWHEYRYLLGTRQAR